MCHDCASYMWSDIVLFLTRLWLAQWSLNILHRIGQWIVCLDLWCVSTISMAKIMVCPWPPRLSTFVLGCESGYYSIRTRLWLALLHFLSKSLYENQYSFGLYEAFDDYVMTRLWLGYDSAMTAFTINPCAKRTKIKTTRFVRVCFLTTRVRLFI